MGRGIFASKITPILGIMGLVLLFFQNCGPTPDGAQFLHSEDGVVGIVDRWAPGKLSFLSPSHLVTEDVEELDVYGICDSSVNGSVLSWQVFSSHDPSVVLSSGSSVCESGAFTLSLTDVYFNSCDEAIELRARLTNDLNSVATTELRVHCSS